MSSETIIKKPVLAFIPKDKYNSISDKNRFLDFVEYRCQTDIFRVKRQFSFELVKKILINYKYEQVLVFNIDEIAESLQEKKKLIQIAIRKRVKIFEIQTGLCVLTDENKPDLNSISWFMLRDCENKKYSIKFISKIISQRD